VDRRRIGIRYERSGKKTIAILAWRASSDGRVGGKLVGIMGARMCILYIFCAGGTSLMLVRVKGAEERPACGDRAKQELWE